MTTSPLHRLQEQADATFIPYGPPRPDGAQIEVVDTFGQYEAEYAAIRKGAAILETPQRAVIEVSGGERLDFLHKMLTNDTKSLQSGQGRRALLLSRAGRILADLIVLETGSSAWLVLDACDAAGLVEELQKYIIMEDVTLQRRDELWQVALHGPQALALVSALAGREMTELKPCEHRQVELAAGRCTLYRFDQAGVPGLHLIGPRDHAQGIYQALLDLARQDGWRTASQIEKEVAQEIQAKEAQPPGQLGVKEEPAGKTRLRPIGWLAFNTARIEAGTPLFHVDFGPDTLPHESGTLKETVSFTKGCYLGQEIVARMQNLGHPKRVMVGLRFADDRMPVAGTPVFDAAAAELPGQAAIGAVTSSTLSPMLGGVAVALAMVKWGKHRPGVEVLVPAEGGKVPAKVQELGFLPSPGK